MSKMHNSLLLNALTPVFTTKQILVVAVCVIIIGMTGCTAAMQQKADQSYLSLKKSLIETIQGKPVEPIAIPADALVAKPASLDQLLRKVGRLAVKDNRVVEITSVDKDRSYLRQGIASGARGSGKAIKITMLNTANRADTVIMLK